MNMDRRNRKQEVIVKKVDVKIKDRGDLKRTDTKKILDENAVRKKIFEDRGDSNSKSINQKPNKTKPITIVDRKQTKQDAKIKNVAAVGKKDISKEKIEENQAPSNIDIRKLIRERYTFKQKQLNDNPTDNKHGKDFVKSDRTVNRSKKQLAVETKYTEKPKDPITADITMKKPVTESTTTRKPIIKTVTSKNGPTRSLYKAVTFGEEKTPLKTLQIDIPTENKVLKDSQKISNSTDTVTIKSKPIRTVKEKPEFRKKYYRKRIGNHRYGSSPDSFKNKSPPTEVAKWAPCCINRHTKPYYEAWINTTLAAISRSSKKDKMFLEKRSIIQSFQRALEERAESPELIYERLKDENYTGRIRVIHK